MASYGLQRRQEWVPMRRMGTRIWCGAWEAEYGNQKKLHRPRFDEQVSWIHHFFLKLRISHQTLLIQNPI